MEQQLQQQEEAASSQSSWGVPAKIASEQAEDTAQTFASRPLTRAEVDAANPLIYQLRRRNPIRDQALAALRGETMTTISPLLEALENPSANGWKSRQVAAWTLGRANLNAEQQAVASVTLSRILKGQISYDVGRFVRGVLRTMLPALIISLPLTAYFWRGDWDTLALMLVSIIVGVGVLCSPATLTISFGADDAKSNRVRAAAAEALGNLQRPEAVGILLGAHLEGNKRVRSAATSALRKVLPTLTPDHYGQLDASVTPDLCRALAHWETTFVLEVVEALGKVGDGRAATALKRWERTEKRSEVRQEIAKILPILLERRRREEESGLLLRGSEVPLETATLLRPSLTRSPDEAQETLLRATQGEKES